MGVGGGEDFVFQSIEHVFDTQSTALHWFYSCLLNITQTVAVNDCSSAPVPISCGVPHGWLWDSFSLFWIPQPVLILLTVTLCSLPFVCFADDSQLQKSAPLQQFHELKYYLKECSHNVKLWITHNKLKLSDDKTKHWSYLHPVLQTLRHFPDSFAVEYSTVGDSLPAHLFMLTWSFSSSWVFALAFSFKTMVLQTLLSLPVLVFWMQAPCAYWGEAQINTTYSCCYCSSCYFCSCCYWYCFCCSLSLLFSLLLFFLSLLLLFLLVFIVGFFVVVVVVFFSLSLFFLFRYCSTCCSCCYCSSCCSYCFCSCFL